MILRALRALRRLNTRAEQRSLARGYEMGCMEGFKNAERFYEAHYKKLLNLELEKGFQAGFRAHQQFQNEKYKTR